MRVLVTGATGFAGRHLVAHLLAAGDEVVGVSRAGVERASPRAQAASAPGVARSHTGTASPRAQAASGPGVDVRSPEAALACVRSAAPDAVIHLAARAHVGESWRDPEGFFSDNVAMARSVLEAVRVPAPDAAVVMVASGEVYGPPASLPVGEGAPLRPQNPYAVSKCSADLLAGFYADGHGLRVARARPFNHAGPGQEPIYAISSFARQVAGALETRTADDGAPVRVVTGNPDARRDYTDVRDVVAAYRALAAGLRSGSVAPGGVFNVCSGRSASAAELVSALGRGCGVEVDHVVDERLLRPHEVMDVRGDATALHAATGWAPQIALERTLTDAVTWWREEIRAGRGGDRTSEAG